MSPGWVRIRAQAQGSTQQSLLDVHSIPEVLPFQPLEAAQGADKAMAIIEAALIPADPSTPRCCGLPCSHSSCTLKVLQGASAKISIQDLGK